MNNIENIEIVIVCVIVLIQLIVFIRTAIKIVLFKKIIPDVDYLSISKLFIPVDALQSLSPKEILAKKEDYLNLGKHKEEQVDEFDSQDLFSKNANTTEEEKIEVNIIENNGRSNKVFQKILYAVNNYLIRNRGASSDFNLVKDIIERNSNSVEEDINLTISIPLYLGLMGTMIGIVIALFNMPNIGLDLADLEANSATLNNGISVLIGGVKIAMIASFIGLGLTIISSGWIFKGSRQFNESKKNALYTFLQIELLPIINQGLASTLDSLQRNLIGFNEEFSNNLNSLTTVFDSNKEAMRIQKELIEALDKTKVSQMTRYNVKVLQQLDVSVEKFEKFNSYMNNVTQTMENSERIVGKTNELLERTDNFKTIAENIEDKLTQSQQLIDFLSDHFKKLEDHKQLVKESVADVGFSISDIFDELKEQIKNSSQAVKEFTTEESDTLKTTLAEGTSTFKKALSDENELLKETLSESRTNLENLEYLANLKTDVTVFKDHSASQGDKIKESLEKLNNNIGKSIEILKKIERKRYQNITANSFNSIKKLFKSKK